MQRRRLDLNLLWKDVTKQIGTHATNVTNWSKGRSAPGLRFWPRIIRFLGYDPRPGPATLGERIRRYRNAKGLSQQMLAVRLQVDPSTLARWERDERSPAGQFLERLQVALRASTVVSTEP